MFRYLAIGLAAMVLALSISCSSTTNISGVAIPVRETAGVQAPTDGSDVMGVQAPTDGSDVM